MSPIIFLHSSCTYPCFIICYLITITTQTISTPNVITFIERNPVMESMARNIKLAIFSMNSNETQTQHK